MRTHNLPLIRLFLVIALMIALVVLSTRMKADTSTCSGQMITLPFNDVSGSAFFCQIAEAYLSGLTNGTSATTYSPTDPVTREQMAAFITRTQDSAIKRGNKRAALQQFWTPQNEGAMKSINVGIANDLTSDGRFVWVTVGGVVVQVDATDGTIVRNWSGAIDARRIIAAAGRIFFTEPRYNATGRVYVINPSVPQTAVATVFSNNTGVSPLGITFDGAYLWTAHRGDTYNPGSITRVRISDAATTYTAGFSVPYDTLGDGTSLWVSDIVQNKVKRIDTATGAVLEDIDVGTGPVSLVFDGINLWVANTYSNSISIIRPGSPSRVIQTLLGNGLDEPSDLAFDGERVMATCGNSDRVSLFRATDLSPLGYVSTGGGSLPEAACSDGLRFWIARHLRSDIV